MDRTMVKIIRAEMEMVPKKHFNEKYGVNIGSATFSQDNATFKVGIADIVNGEVLDKTVVDFKQSCVLFGLKEDDLGKVFKSYDGETYTIVGAKPRASKYPIICTNSSGKRYKFSALQVRNSIN